MTIDDLGDMFQGINRLYTEQRELAAIWLKSSLMTGQGKKIRIEAGYTVRVMKKNNDSELVDVTEELPPTHKVLACYGTMYDQFEMTLIDLKTNEPLQIKL